MVRLRGRGVNYGGALAATGNSYFSTNLPQAVTGKKTAQESRNVRLFLAVKEAAPYYDAAGLLAYGRRYNATEFSDEPDGPLPDAKVTKAVASALGYKERGELMRRGTGPRIITGLDEIDAFADNPRAFWLWSWARAFHGDHGKPFPLSPDGPGPCFRLGGVHGTQGEGAACRGRAPGPGERGQGEKTA